MSTKRKAEAMVKKAEKDKSLGQRWATLRRIFYLC